MKRRERAEGSNVTWYRWDLGWNLLNEENGSGTLERSYTHSPVLPTGTILAHVDGTNPSTGDYEYYFTDHLGSTRHIFDQSKSIINSYSFKPYGELMNWSGSGTGTNHLFTGKPWDAAAAQYYFPYRQYDPRQGRWTMPDPLGMVDGPNLYGYVNMRPTRNTDPLGLCIPIIIIIGGLIILGGCGGGKRPSNDANDHPEPEEKPQNEKTEPRVTPGPEVKPPDVRIPSEAEVALNAALPPGVGEAATVAGGADACRGTLNWLDYLNRVDELSDDTGPRR